MKITEKNFRNFYFGAAAEAYIQSELYTFGYEAFKAQPDIGYDLYVSNKALSKFLNVEEKIFNIQIKSRLVYKEETEFCLTQDDYEMLLNDTNGVLVCVLQVPNISAEKDSFAYNRDTFRMDGMECYIEETMARMFIPEEKSISVSEIEIKFPVVGYTRVYFWMCNAMLHRLESEGLIKEKTTDKGEKLKYIIVSYEDEVISILEKSNGYGYCPVHELLNIKYLLEPSELCKKKFEEGKMFGIDIE